MKTSDISDDAILNLLADHQGEWAFWHIDDLSFHSEPGKKYPIAPGFPYKLIHAKFKKLYKRGLIGGCDCGCRGDFEITDKGLELIGRPRVKRYTGY